MAEISSEIKYRMPAEWETHKSTIICWPHQKEDWPGKFAPIPWVYAEIVRKIIPGEKVNILIQSKAEKEKVKKILAKVHVDLSYIEFVVAETDRGWMRDTSPAFVKSEDNIYCALFKFNGWAKYDNWKKDKNIPKILSKSLKINLIDVLHNNQKVVLEGGSIDINGKGTLITTEECLLDEKIQTRNPGFTKSDYETIFKKYLGITNVLWLGKGIAGDDTHGHVDDLCRFVNKDTVVLCRDKNQSDDNYYNLEENFEHVEDFKLEDGSKLNVFELPMPSPLHFEDLRLPASYANFYICNQAVLVPTFNDKNDKLALGIISELLPNKEVIGIHAVDLVWGLGTLHCLTHEEPA